EIILLHAFEVRGSVYTDYMGVDREFKQIMWDDAAKKLELVKQSIIESEDVNITTQIRKGTVKNAIAETAGETGAALVIMGTLGTSGIKEKLFGSKTSSIIGSIDMPVMAIPYEYEWKKPEKVLIATNHFEQEPAILNFVFELADLYMAQVAIAVFTDEEDD